MYSPGEILNLALLIEENGENFYYELTKLTEDSRIKALLERFAEEERTHRRYFLELKRYVDRVFKPDVTEKISRFLTAEAIGTRLFSINVQKLHRIETIEEAIQLAITLEEDSIVFYELLRSISNREDSLQILDIIIKEEISHVDLLKTIALDLGIASG
ncbi:MAG: ferritin family protein [Syntrophobacterales bacterium]|nr:ferritin family protein [Syntrophobacterales bacterium]